jgi:hypothetical protein
LFCSAPATESEKGEGERARARNGMLLFSPSKSTPYPFLVLLLFALVILEMNCFLCRQQNAGLYYSFASFNLIHFIFVWCETQNLKAGAILEATVCSTLLCFAAAIMAATPGYNPVSSSHHPVSVFFSLSLLSLSLFFITLNSTFLSYLDLNRNLQLGHYCICVGRSS